MRATLVKDLGAERGPLGYTHQQVWHVSPPYHGSEHLCVSATVANGVPETYLFTCDAEGDDMTMSELPGSQRGVFAHRQVLIDIGYGVVLPEAGGTMIDTVWLPMRGEAGVETDVTWTPLPAEVGPDGAEARVGGWHLVVETGLSDGSACMEPDEIERTELPSECDLWRWSAEHAESGAIEDGDCDSLDGGKRAALAYVLAQGAQS